MEINGRKFKRLNPLVSMVLTGAAILGTSFFGGCGVNKNGEQTFLGATAAQALSGVQIQDTGSRSNMQWRSAGVSGNGSLNNGPTTIGFKEGQGPRKPIFGPIVDPINDIGR